MLKAILNHVSVCAISTKAGELIPFHKMNTILFCTRDKQVRQFCIHVATCVQVYIITYMPLAIHQFLSMKELLQRQRLESNNDLLTFRYTRSFEESVLSILAITFILICDWFKLNWFQTITREPHFDILYHHLTVISTFIDI